MSKKNRVLQVGTLFSGMGAPEEALKKAKIPHEVKFACDISSDAKKTHLHNHDAEIFYDDINDLPQNPPHLDLLIFGFPCQPFSLAGKGNCLADARGQLVFNAIDILKRTKAKYFIAENVPGLLTRHDGEVLDQLLEALKRAGYRVEYQLLDSLDFGLPQRRERLWIVGRNRGQSLLPVHVKKRRSTPLRDYLDHKVDGRYFATKEFLSKKKVQHRISSNKGTHLNCITKTIARNGSSSEYIGYVAAVHNAIGQSRKPTPLECCRLFGFGNKFSFPEDVSVTAQYEMVANTMTVPVVKLILETIWQRISLTR